MDKQVQLRRHKWFATLLFFIMAIIYVICEAMFKEATWAGYIKAFAEAAMIGALADWFAVVALFRHPLGIPIPHTNLIESSKKKIGSNLGTFVTENFLTASAIKPRLENLHIALKLGQWLLIEKNRNNVTTEMVRILKEGLSKLDDKDMSRIIEVQAITLLDKIPVNKVVGDGLAKVVNENMHQDWITTLATYLGKFLYENHDLVKQKVKQESYFLIPGFVDNLIAEKITNGGIRYMEEIAADLNHPARKKITGKLQEIAADIQQGGQWAERLSHLKKELLSPQHVADYSALVWQHVKKQIANDLDQQSSGITKYIDKLLIDIGHSLTTDSIRRQRIDQFVQVQAFKLIMKYRQSAGEMISNTVANWPSRQLSEKLELEVGKDLQFIRINGTLVGGTVGLLIYILTKWLG